MPLPLIAIAAAAWAAYGAFKKENKKGKRK